MSAKVLLIQILTDMQILQEDLELGIRAQSVHKQIKNINQKLERLLTKINQETWTGSLFLMDIEEAYIELDNIEEEIKRSKADEQKLEDYLQRRYKDVDLQDEQNTWRIK